MKFPTLRGVISTLIGVNMFGLPLYICITNCDKVVSLYALMATCFGLFLTFPREDKYVKSLRERADLHDSRSVQTTSELANLTSELRELQAYISKIRN